MNAIEDLRRWLTTVVARISLDMLRSRKARREDYPGTWLPEPIITDDAAVPNSRPWSGTPSGIALLIVLETLSPAERLAFVLHDVFARPVRRDQPACSSAPRTRRVSWPAEPAGGSARLRLPTATCRASAGVVEAFLDAARHGNFEALIDLLDPDVTFRLDTGPALGLAPIHGAQNVARHMLATAPPSFRRARSSP